MQDGSVTTLELVNATSLSPVTVRKYLNQYIDAGYVRVLARHKEKDDMRQLHVFQWIDGKPIPDDLPRKMEVKKKRREPPSPLRDAILNAYREHKVPLGATHVAEILGRNERTIKSVIRNMRPTKEDPYRKKYLYVHSYDPHVGVRGKPTPLYRLGPLRDAKKPEPSRSDINKRYKEKMGALLRLKLQQQAGKPIDHWMHQLSVNTPQQQTEEVIVQQKPEQKAKKRRTYSSQPETHPWKEAARKGYRSHVEAQKERNES
jgi:hypothetical protein